MSVSSSTLRKLAELSLSPEQMAGVLGVIADMAEADEIRRENQAERKRKQRAKAKNEGEGDHPESVTVTGQSQDSHRDIDAKKEMPPTPPKEKNTKENPPKGGQKKGTRIPDDFEPSLSEAQSIGLSEAQAVRERDAFRDYWRGIPGQRGVKLDWPATWRNWCRKASERVHPRQGQPPPREDGFARALREDLERERMKRHEPPDHETTGYLDAGVTGTDQSGAHVVDIFAAPSLRR